MLGAHLLVHRLAHAGDELNLLDAEIDELYAKALGRRASQCEHVAHQLHALNRNRVLGRTLTELGDDGVLDDLAQTINGNSLYAAGRRIEFLRVNDLPFDEEINRHVLAIEREHFLRRIVNFQDTTREFYDGLNERNIPFQARLVIGLANLTEAQFEGQFSFVNRECCKADDDERETYDDYRTES